MRESKLEAKLAKFVAYDLVWWLEGWVMLVAGILKILTLSLNIRINNIYPDYLEWAIRLRFKVFHKYGVQR